RGISFREDRSNAQTKYIRNKIRHKIIPLLKEINPSAETSLNETAQRIAELDEFTGRKINDIRDGIFSVENDYISIDIGELMKEAINRSVLFELFIPWGITGNNLPELEKVIKGRTGARLMTAGHLITKNRGRILISPVRQQENLFYTAASADDLMALPFVESAGFVDRSELASIPATNDIACLDAGEITFPLTIRKKEDGDYFYPLGMDGKKKLSDFLIDGRFSLPDKEKILVMKSGDRIAWVMGYRIDNRFRITETTRRVLMIKLRSSAR
ncbi:MAG: tRNA lysidine(34) synthetase TilS, partial [Bacteroidales bacterium]|nr:tRNA lysidine(34) synthetase TilS [Bacteroidales bacterium]